MGCLRKIYGRYSQVVAVFHKSNVRFWRGHQTVESGVSVSWADHQEVGVKCERQTHNTFAIPLHSPLDKTSGYDRHTNWTKIQDTPLECLMSLWNVCCGMWINKYSRPYDIFGGIKITTTMTNKLTLASDRCHFCKELLRRHLHRQLSSESLGKIWRSVHQPPTNANQTSWPLQSANKYISLYIYGNKQRENEVYSIELLRTCYNTNKSWVTHGTYLRIP